LSKEIRVYLLIISSYIFNGLHVYPVQNLQLDAMLVPFQ